MAAFPSGLSAEQQEVLVAASLFVLLFLCLVRKPRQPGSVVRRVLKDILSFQRRPQRSSAAAGGGGAAIGGPGEAELASHVSIGIPGR